MLIRTDLVPLLSEVDKRTLEKNEAATNMLQEQCFEWIDEMMFELKLEQGANERGASLEGLAASIERSVIRQSG
jgi:hypothetical protein